LPGVAAPQHGFRIAIQGDEHVFEKLIKVVPKIGIIFI
jgi:hypothetical protein